MATSEIEPESSGTLVMSRATESDNHFANLRSVRWRVNLGVLPSSASSVDELRRATADSRRRYALLRRRLLMDPHLLKDDRDSLNLFIDNPLSQNPDSAWGQFFRNAELEKTVDQDLSRLYPEHWCYFQAPGCQGMLRRILLLWCLKHPEYGYGQGMHELLAPLLYVLHVDIMRLSQVRKDYDDYFTDMFDSLSFKERDISYTFDFNKFIDSMDDDELSSQGYSKKIKSLDELDPEVQSIVMLSDSYGAEGELGSVLSEKFMEHDAYCMFDALMSGTNGCVSMASFFGYSPAKGSHTRLSPVLGACSAFYRLLAVVDASLYSHLVELGVEPQYFGLRWLRVLFGREFLLQDLLLLWDEIFLADNSARTFTDDDEDSRNHMFSVFDCPRGTLISGMAVSMILYLRSSLLSTENATCCLQRLLNFPEDIDLNKIICKAKWLQALVLSSNGVFEQRSSVPKSVPSNSSLIVTPDCYWEKKWRLLQKSEEEEEKQMSPPTQKKKKWLKVTNLFRAVTDLSRYKTRSVLESLSQKLSSNPEGEANGCPVTVSMENSPTQETEEGSMDFHTADEDSITSDEESSSFYSDPTSLVRDSNYPENDSNSSTVLTLCPDENSNSIDDLLSAEDSSVSSEPTSPASRDCSTSSDSVSEEKCTGQQTCVDSPLPISPHSRNDYPETQCNEDDSTDKSVSIITKEHKLVTGIVQWFLKCKRNFSGEETSKRNATESHPQALSSHKTGDLDSNLMKTRKTLGQSMLEHIQVIELIFQQEPGLVQGGLIKNIAKTELIEKGQDTATTALRELRKISNLLSGM
ncbi:unnamed protein product [Eruca vesicaria subsp. sativa]|uniref:Rab-GAP TBC domain-containing protein n=1 Tax=Eruca vesicaria subsp. sativa TaxID=29727 RepID=A0ABC8KBT4_ERUVS|nr:unnamed protein product [Eruca vesicaria subsp. sativa]